MILKLKMKSGETIKEALAKAIEIAKKLDVDVSFISVEHDYRFDIDKYSIFEEKLKNYSNTVKQWYLQESR